MIVAGYGTRGSHARSGALEGSIQSTTLEVRHGVGLGTAPIEEHDLPTVLPCDALGG